MVSLFQRTHTIFKVVVVIVVVVGVGVVPLLLPSYPTSFIFEDSCEGSLKENN